jgi:uncharacterized membrane protein YfcA
MVHFSHFFHFFLLASLVGIFAGLLGIGGAIILVPVLIWFYGWPEKLAQGTVLAMMLPPIGLLAVLEYHKIGAIRITAAVLAAVCFIPGAYVGARLADVLPAPELGKLFGVLAVFLGLKMIWQK